MKVFLDTNVLVSSFITRGLCADIFRIILSEHDLLLCTYVLTELEDVLKKKIDLPDKQITSILQYLRTFEIITNHTPPTKIELRDKNDIPVISAALNSRINRETVWGIWNHKNQIERQLVKIPENMSLESNGIPWNDLEILFNVFCNIHGVAEAVTTKILYKNVSRL